MTIGESAPAAAALQARRSDGRRPRPLWCRKPHALGHKDNRAALQVLSPSCNPDPYCLCIDEVTCGRRALTCMEELGDLGRPAALRLKSVAILTMLSHRRTIAWSDPTFLLSGRGFNIYVCIYKYVYVIPTHCPMQLGAISCRDLGQRWRVQGGAGAFAGRQSLNETQRR